MKLYGAEFTKAEVGDSIHVHDSNPKWWWRPVIRLRVKVPFCLRRRYPRPLVRAVHAVEDRFCFEDGPNAGVYRIVDVVSGTEVEIR